MVELQTALNIAILLVAGTLGWLMKALFQRMDRLEKSDEAMAKSLSDLRVELPSNYTSKADFKDMGDKIFGAIRALQTETITSMRRIEDKLDLKQDRQK